MNAGNGDNPGKKTVEGFNSFPEGLREGRRRSSLERQLGDIMSDADHLHTRTMDYRRKRLEELERCEALVLKVDGIVHEAALRVMDVVRFKHLCKTRAEEKAEAAAAEAEAEAEVSERERLRAEKKAKVQEDLDKLMGMVNMAKQNTATAMLRELWAGWLRGKTAAYIARWRNKLLDEQAGIGTSAEAERLPAQPRTRTRAKPEEIKDDEGAQDGDQYKCEVPFQSDDNQVVDPPTSELKGMGKAGKRGMAAYKKVANQK